MASSYTQSGDTLLLDPKTQFALQRFDRRRRRLLLIRALMVAIISFIISMLVIMLIDYLFFLRDEVRWILSMAGYAITALAVWYTGLNRLRIQDPQRLARQLESADPRVRDDLLSAVELADPRQANGSPAFCDSLQRSVARRIGSVDMRRLLPMGLIQRWLSLGATIALVCVVVSLIPTLQFPRRMGRAALPGIAIERASQTIITILKPQPATGHVAEGDVVAIVAELTGKPPELVTLRWREPGGDTSQTIMSPRQATATLTPGGFIKTPNDATGQQLTSHPRYAANLSFRDQPLEYQLIAGDAITWWHKLTPLPRPRTSQFDVRYQFPQYAQLDDRIESNSHGDLQAFVGSIAEVTVTFDQAVAEAQVRYLGGNHEVPMKAVDSSRVAYTVSLPIRSNEQYQVDAVSVESGLDNPFSPTFTILPVPDAAPTVRWITAELNSLLLSPIETPIMAVSIADDMPIAQAVHEYSINGQSPVQRPLKIEPGRRELEHRWEWDLTRLADANGETVRLVPGDLIRTRVLVTDRRGQQANSNMLDVLIADEGFKPDRHDRLLALAALARELRQWFQQSESLLGEQQQTAPAEEEELSKRVAQWSLEAELLVDHIAGYLRYCGNPTSASNMELLGLSVSHLARELPTLIENSEPRRDREIKQQIELTRQLMANLLGQSLTLDMAADAMLLRKSLQPAVAADSQIAASRIPRYLKVANDRLKSITALVDQHAELLPDSTRRHFQGDGWKGWSDRWSLRLDESLESSQDSVSISGNAAVEFHRELNDRIAHALVDGRLASTNAKTVDTVRQSIGGLAEALENVNRIGRELQKTEQLSRREKSPVKSEQLQEALLDQRARYDAKHAELLNRIETETDLHRQRPVVDLRYAADLGLLVQALKSVNRDGYQAFRDIPPEEVYKILAAAIDVLESSHHVNRVLWQLVSLRDAERDFVDSAESKIAHAFWLDQYRLEIVSPLKRLRQRGVAADLIDLIDQTRRNQDFDHAKNRIDVRRWSSDPPVSAFRSLQAMTTQVEIALQGLEADVTDAREQLLRFVKTLAEQAREAAELASIAAERNQDALDADQSQVSDLAQQQRVAEMAARETVQRLHDQANTADLTDEQQRELAHDADLAAAAVDSALRRAKRTLQDAREEAEPELRREKLENNVESLAQLAATLERVADHFDADNRDEDSIAASRDALRQAVEESQLRDQAELRQQRAEAIARAAASDPHEMLRRLESELQKNEVMQSELSDIAARAMESALRKLQQAGEEERTIQRSLQRSDPVVTEYKKRLDAILKNAAMQIDALESASIDATRRADDLAQHGMTGTQVDEIRKPMRRAVERAQASGGEQALLSELAEAITEVTHELDQAVTLIEQLRQSIAGSRDQDKEIGNREHAIVRLQQIENTRRNSLIRALSDQQRAWTNVVRETGPRIQQAQRQQQNAQETIRKLKLQVSDETKQDETSAQLRVAEQQLDESTKTANAVRETNEFANQMADQAMSRAGRLRSEKQPALDVVNPIAEAIDTTLQSTRTELESVHDDLEKWLAQAERQPPLQVAQEDAVRLTDRQRGVQQDVADAGEDILRAGRHEQRLEKHEVAAGIESVANAVTQEAEPAARQAGQSLQQASHDVEQSAAADNDLRDAAEEIQRSAAMLQQLLEGPSAADGSERSPPSPPSPSDEQSKQMAKTLDELDRAMLAAQPPAESSDQSEGDAGESAPSDSNAGSQGQPPSDAQPGNASPQSAAEASPTLASMLENERQNAARQRNGQTRSTAASREAEAGQPGGELSDGEISIVDLDDPAIESMFIDRTGDDWGQLRQQGAEDVLEGQWSTVLPQYRREVSAYFRAIAERSVEESQE